MLSFYDLYTRFTKITSDTSSANITFGKALINETYKLILGSRKWWFAEDTFTTTSTASQQTIKLPADYRRLETFNITNGNTKYTPIEIANPMQWDAINADSTLTSDFPQYFTIRGNNISVYPKIATAGLTITIEYLRMPRDMSADNYTTGTVDALASGGTAVTGSGTTWTAAMIGRYIKITSEGNWYKITARSSNTAITIDKPYEGTTITTPGAEAYTIAELPIIPEAYQDLLWYRPVAIYHMMKGDENKSRYYMSGDMRQPGMYERQLRDMIREMGSQTTQNIDAGYRRLINPNDYPINIT